MPVNGEGQRAWRCKRYALCISEAAKADLDDLPGCPCDRFELDREVVTWRDVESSRHLIVAALWPEAWQAFQSLQSTPDPNKKRALLREVWRNLGLSRREHSRIWGER